MPPIANSAPPAVLSFSSADPTGGCGVQADTLTLAAMGCHPLTVVCAITIRDTRGVEDCLALDDDSVVMQARTILEDVPVHAFRIGVVGSVENLVAIAEILSDYPDIPVVLEPALFEAGRGDEALADEFGAALVELILPQTTILVSDSLEILRLADAGYEGDDEEPELEGDDLARLLALGVGFVLLTDTGNHGPQAINVLHGEAGVISTDARERLAGQFFGARATLSAAIAAALALGMDVPDAVKAAQAFTWRALAGAYRPGMGPALPDRLLGLRSGARDAG
ncbi:MAG: bifunctional hydroxymethylpyrimidine kinase/phosphomethylpyrimidine kinase [Zoogloeaceae bacterium]|nr:bifunctional hydroxymethylpyrimidine kinase/phosphomethylpyrimidine kinase [Zoogloeaceae bacterium]